MATATRSGITGSSKTPAPAPAAPAAPRRQLSDRILDWINAHRTISSWIGAILVVGALLFVWQLSTKRKTEEIASRELQSARFAFENQNLPLAASELSRVIENYSGTDAAQEGRLLLANVRLSQGQPQQAVEVLRDHAAELGKAYQAQGYGLLGGAYENLGRFQDAAGAYQEASDAARMDFLKTQWLSDAARAWISAADTAKAISAYERIVKDFPKEAAVTEAKVRLGELKKGAIS